MSLAPRPKGLPKRIPLRWWVWRALPGRFTANKPAAFWIWRKWRNSQVKPAPTPVPPPAPAQLTMYDSVTISEIPASAKAVAGYVGGHWPTYNQLRLKFPKAHKLSIAIAANESADCLDVEPGDAVISQAAAWVKKQKAAGARKPVVYTSLSQAQLLINTLARAGLPRASYRLWTAHYTDKPHRCTPICGLGFKSKADATQYTDKALGRNLDASLCSPVFFADG